MDIDAYSTARQKHWRRLEELNRKRHLSGAEVDELMGLYHLASSDLATLTSTATDPDVVFDLSRVVSSARGRISQPRASVWKSIGSFLSVTIPLALFRVGPLLLGVALYAIFIAVFTGVWAGMHPEVLLAMNSEEEWRSYAQDAFAAYYSNYPAPDFMAQVWSNNASIAVMTVALFFTGVFPVYTLTSNFTVLGVSGAAMYRYGDIGVFFSLITPHGILELSCIILAVTIALRLLWTLLVPGPRTRTSALAQDGRELVPVALVLILLLAISGIEEAFLTPAPLQTWGKVTIALVVYAALVFWIVFFGLWAKRRGLSGDLRPDLAGYVAD